jgi:hypothetical protein
MMVMARMTIRALIAVLFITMPAMAANSPPVGSQFPVQPEKTGNYTIKQTDLRTQIPFNCSSPCTVTFPQSTSSWPKGYPILIESVGSAAVTISATTSVLYGMPLTSGSIVLPNNGNFAYVTADASNNYFANGFTGSGGGGGGVSSLSAGLGITLSPNPITSTGSVSTNGTTTNVTVASACEGTSCTPVTQCFVYSAGVLESISTGACSGAPTNYLLIQTGSAMLIQTGSHLLIQ